MEEFISTAFRYAILFCAGIFIMIPFIAQSRIYYPSRQHFLVNIKYEDVFIKTPDGIKINAWYIPPKEKDITVLFCHGNGGNLSFYEEILTLLKSKGYGVLAIDYRGYGKSEGKPDEQGLYEDLRSAVRYLREEKNIHEKDVILLGLSLGGAVVAQVASENEKFRGVILLSTFTNIPEMVSEVLHRAYFGVKTDYSDYFSHKLFSLMPYFQKFDTKSKIGNIKSPLLIAHSVPDNIVPVEMSRELAFIRQDTRVFISETGGHNEYSWFYPELLNFLGVLEQTPGKS